MIKKIIMNKRYLLLLLLFFGAYTTGCSVNYIYHIKYSITCSEATELLITYCDSSNRKQELVFTGNEWNKEFDAYLYSDRDYIPYIYVKNNTNDDITVTAKIFIDYELDIMETMSGPYEDMLLEAREIESYDD